MNIYTPVPVAHERYEPLGNGWALRITRWPGQVVCARIDVVPMDAISLDGVIWV